MKWILITGIVLVSLAIVSGLIYIRVNSIGPEKIEEAKPDQVTAPLLEETLPEGTAQISDEVAMVVVRYSQNKFYPAQVKVNPAGSCLLAVFNEGDKPLQIGLSPHQAAGDPGVSYPEILPKQSIIIDPRYRIENISFHSHQIPRAEFTVTLVGDCGNL